MTDYKRLVEEVASDLFFIPMKLLHERLPCSGSIFQMKHALSQQIPLIAGTPVLLEDAYIDNSSPLRQIRSIAMPFLITSADVEQEGSPPNRVGEQHTKEGRSKSKRKARR